MTISLWHNPRCSKSRNALALLEEQGAVVDVRLYLKEAPSAAELKNVLKLLGTSARDLMRKGEAVYKELGLKDVTSEVDLITAMVEHPILIERPLGLTKSKAVVGRPPEEILTLLS